jgi:hypothetical protein
MLNRFALIPKDMNSIDAHPNIVKIPSNVIRMPGSKFFEAGFPLCWLPATIFGNIHT